MSDKQDPHVEEHAKQLAGMFPGRDESYRYMAMELQSRVSGLEASLKRMEFGRFDDVANLEEELDAAIALLRKERQRGDTYRARALALARRLRDIRAEFAREEK